MTTDPTPPALLRTQLLHALDFSACQGLGYGTPEELLAAYDASRIPPPTDRAATPPAVWVDGHPQLEAIAAAVWEQCGRSDSGMCVEDDPRNIAVAALAALRRTATAEPPADQGALRERIAEALLDHLSRTAEIRTGRDGELAFMPEVTDAERLRIADAVLAVLPEPADEVDADTVANRAAHVISAMGAEIRELKRERTRYGVAWHNARRRAGVLSAEVTRRAPLLGEYATEIARLRRELAASERIRENADFHLGQEMARRQRAEKETTELRRMADETATDEAAADPFAGGSYLTAEHDTLGMIAARYGGNPLAWEMANPWVTSPSMPLPAGLRVAIPAAEPAAGARQDGAQQ